MKLTPSIMEYAYRRGYFPMPDPESDELHWFDPNPRAVFYYDLFHVSRSLRKFAKNSGFNVTMNTAFLDVVNGCARSDETWINQEFKSVYLELYLNGKAHSIEIWSGEDLVGGIFGLHFGKVFHGESMFSKKSNASKIALWVLVETLRRSGVEFLEVQFVTAHLKSMGVSSVSRDEYHQRLEALQQGDAKIEVSHFSQAVNSVLN